jgi:glycosyltransferase involved in cell wall biosynthesis
MRNKTLSIIMPALNEEKNINDAISHTLQAFDDFQIRGEIVVIDDGCTDRTVEVVKNIQDKDDRVGILHHDAPKGIGASFWDGLDETKGEFVCMLPGDFENDPKEIMRYWNLLEHVDMVIPFVFNKEVRSLFRNFLSLVYRFVVNTTFSVYFNYTNGTVLYRKSVLSELKYRSTGFFFQTDIIIRTVKKGYLFAEVPYRLGTRNSGISRAVSFPSLLQVIRGYFRLVKDIYYQVGFDGEYAPDSQTAYRRKTARQQKQISAIK